MVCRSCGSNRQSSFTVRVLIYWENAQEAPVAVFPEFSLCQGCGKADFVLSRADLCFLEKRQQLPVDAVPASRYRG